MSKKSTNIMGYTGLLPLVPYIKDIEVVC